MIRAMVTSAIALGLMLPDHSRSEPSTQSPGQSERAPAETAQFGQLVGNWRIRDYGLDAEGNWQEGNGADWNFYWILDGTAIQDDWIAPSLDTEAPPQGRQYGTNIRIYNPAEKRWEMAWMANTGAKVDTFTAVMEDGALVMRGDYTGKPTRIQFFDITAQRFSWKMEQQTDSEWKTVYRIEAIRVDDAD